MADATPVTQPATPEAAQPQPETPVVPIFQTENLPLTDAQKYAVKAVQNRALNVKNQILTMQVQEAQLQTLQQETLMKIAIENKIDMDNFVLDENLNVIPKPAQAPRAPALRPKA